MLDIPAIKKLCEAATPEPWRVETFVRLFEVFDEHGSSIYNGKDNRKFIAQARTLVPQLVEALEEAQGQLARIETGMCTCDAGPVYACLVHDPPSVLGRILTGT